MIQVCTVIFFPTKFCQALPNFKGAIIQQIFARRENYTYNLRSMM